MSNNNEVALCLSGGGYRAMLFHVGALWRLNELAYLPKLSRISSVSGGSITAGVLGLHWENLDFGDTGVAANFDAELVQPLRNLATKTIDISGGLFSLTQLSRFSNRIVVAYRRHLFGRRTIQALPDTPRFVINATNLQSGVLWRFSKPYMRDYLVGEVKNPAIELAVAVAASSAFPPVLSPVWLRLKRSDYSEVGVEGEKYPKLLTKVVLSDGAVYDNLGLEPVKNPKFRTVLVSDGGGKLTTKVKVPAAPGRQLFRVMGVIDNQVRSLRKRHLIDSFKAQRRRGTYWGIQTHITDYELEDSLDCPEDKTAALANTPTRLAKLSSVHQQRLINWGYAVADAGMRAHVETGAQAPDGFPYPDSGI